MPADRGVVVMVGLALVLVVALGATTGIASGGHGPEAANYTVTPLEDRSPGADNVEYGQTIVGTAGVDLETLTRTVAIYESGGWSGCGPTSASVFGIDRGDTHDGYEIDEELTDNVKSFSAGEDRLETKYNGENDIGASTYFDDGDEFVVIADCIDNPDQPGWYRITGRTTGVTAADETVTYGSESHYFWICNCEDEAAAREQLGPPPSEPAATPTPAPTGTATDTAADGGQDDGDRELSAEPTLTETDRTATAAPNEDGPSEGGSEDDGAPPGTPTDRETPTEGPDDWSAVVYRTPTRNEGAGFGPLVAFVGLLVGALLVGRY